MNPGTPMRSQGRYESIAASKLAERWRRPLVIAMTTTTSTLDVAHELAEGGAPFGTVVLADEQSAGRGRGGKRWTSPAGDGVWLTTIERPQDASALDVLSLRVGLAAAKALEPFAGAPVAIKWPNDLYLAANKLAGILIEVRWRGAVPDWVVVGLGVNVRKPAVPGAAGLGEGTTRLAVLDVLLPTLDAAVTAGGALTAAELAAIGTRDAARSRRVAAPVAGRAEGIAASGELLVRDADDVLHQCRTGSLVFMEEG